MITGHPEYGCSISQEKTLSNFDYRDNVLNMVDPAQQSVLNEPVRHIRPDLILTCSISLVRLFHQHVESVYHR